MNNMTVFLFLAIMCLGFAVYGLVTYLEKREEKKKNPAEDPGESWGAVLPEYLGRTIEITVKTPMFSIDIIHSQKGILTDLDEEWMELECMEKKKKVQKILRIDQISAVKEIR